MGQVRQAKLASSGGGRSRTGKVVADCPVASVACVSATLCEIASKRDPAREGTHVIDYSGESIPCVGSRFARNLTPLHSKLS